MMTRNQKIGFAIGLLLAISSAVSIYSLLAYLGALFESFGAELPTLIAMLIRFKWLDMWLPCIFWLLALAAYRCQHRKTWGVMLTATYMISIACIAFAAYIQNAPIYGPAAV
jgi:type II secretory pathway component PulF